MDNLKQSQLDRIWSRGGMKQLRQYFNGMAGKNAREALRLINDEDLSFPVLFLLTDDIYALDLYRDMSPRNKTAMRLCAIRTMPAGWFDTSWETSDDGTLRMTLQWMFATGKNWDGPYEGPDAYDAVLDYAAVLLTGTFEDKSALPDIADLIFRRNRKGLYIHDLVWGFFQTLDADALKHVARRLKSADSRDVELAGKLLRLDISAPHDRKKLAALYDLYTRWLDENGPYLYLTGEHFQMTSQPNHLDFDQEAKYLQKTISPRFRTPDVPLTEDEIACLNQYRQAREDEREVLASYSQKLRSRDMRLWDEWIKSQVAQQVIAARKDMGSSRDYY